jgi:hypothetical protein
MKSSFLFRKKIFYILEFPLKNKWTIFLDKLSTSEDPSTNHLYLFKILVQELISKEKVCKPFICGRDINASKNICMKGLLK